MKDAILCQIDVLHFKKTRWSNYYDNLEKFWLKMWFRSQERGDDIYLRRYEHFPEYYRFINLKLSIEHLGITMFWIFKNYQSRQLGAGPLDGPLLRLPRPGKRI